MTSTVHANHPKPRPDVVVRLPGGPPLLVPAIAVLTVAAVAVSIHTAEPTPSPRRSALHAGHHHRPGNLPRPLLTACASRRRLADLTTREWT